MIVDGNGLPLAFKIAAGQSHELASAKEIIDAVRVQPRRRGAPRRRPEAFAGDKGYSTGWLRDHLKRRRIEDVITTKENEKRRRRFDKKKYRKRNVVERAIGWLKESRRIATRFEKLAVNYLAMIYVATVATYLS